MSKLLDRADNDYKAERDENDFNRRMMPQYLSSIRRLIDVIEKFNEAWGDDDVPSSLDKLQAINVEMKCELSIAKKVIS